MRSEGEGRSTKVVEDLKQQMSSKSAELEKEKKERSAAVDRVKDVDEYVVSLQHQCFL